MTSFKKIKERAEKRKGGPLGLKELLPKLASKKSLIETGDDRYLAMMTKCINQAGFSWKVIEKKRSHFIPGCRSFSEHRCSITQILQKRGLISNL